MQNSVNHPAASKSGQDKIFQLFKYAIYLMLLYSVVAFFVEDHKAASVVFQDGISLSNLFQAYPQFIDTLSWYLLLILFELETYSIESDETYDRYKWPMRVVYGLCYALIIMAFVGYARQMVMVYSFDPSPITDLCANLGGSIHSVVNDLNAYTPLSKSNCASLSAPFYVHQQIGLVADEDTLVLIKRMIATDVLNAGAWLLIVLVLQVDVLMQEWGRLTTKFYRTNLAIKLVLYVILFVCAGYWWAFGTYLDFQDSALWILAFFFIELNLFKWHEEERDLIKD